jgi:hypothetical protein
MRNTSRAVQPGIYEIQHTVSSLYLDSLSGRVYNGVYDDALTLSDRPSRMGKVGVLFKSNSEHFGSADDILCCCVHSRRSVL